MDPRLRRCDRIGGTMVDSARRGQASRRDATDWPVVRSACRHVADPGAASTENVRSGPMPACRQGPRSAATETVTSVLRRFAPGFRDIAVARAVPAARMADHSITTSAVTSQSAPTRPGSAIAGHPRLNLAHTDSPGIAAVFCGDSARRRRARHVRLVCRSNAVAHRVRHHPPPLGHELVWQKLADHR